MLYTNSKYYGENYYGSPFLTPLEGEDKYKQAAYLLHTAKKIVVLTGAGFSTASGLSDFRSKQGLYEERPETILSLRYFKYHIDEVYDFLEKYINVENVQPNFGHFCLKKLEDLGKQVNVVTQNIDNLHQLAGSSKVLEFHGTLKTGSCVKCGKKHLMKDLHETKNYYCDCKTNSHKKVIKPDIVFYDESVHYLQESIDLMKDADLVLVMGTSLVVQPFASLPNYTKAETPIIVINRDSTYLDDYRMSCVFKEDINNTLSKLMMYYKVFEYRKKELEEKNLEEMLKDIPEIEQFTISSIKEQIKVYEEIYKMSTEEFVKKYEETSRDGNVDEKMWYRNYQMLKEEKGE